MEMYVLFHVEWDRDVVAGLVKTKEEADLWLQKNSATVLHPWCDYAVDAAGRICARYELHDVLTLHP